MADNMKLTKNQDLFGQHIHVFGMSAGISAHRGIVNPIKHLRWGFLRK